MFVEPASINDAAYVKFDTYWDDRGSFEEAFNIEKFHALGLPVVWAQDNLSYSHQNVIRGLHYQKVNPQGKLVRCLQGRIWDVCVDLRPQSNTYGCYFSAMLEGNNGTALYVPPGCAHGFKTLSPTALVSYKCTTVYNKESDAGVRWNDPDIGINWPGEHHILSDKDKSLPLLRMIDHGYHTTG